MNILRMNNTKTTILYYIGIASLFFAFEKMSVQNVLTSIFVHLLVISVFSAVTHRYFCHRAYESNKTLAWFLSIIPALYGYSTPAGWASLHAAHHAYADTDKDTHLKGIKGLFTANYRKPSLKFAIVSKWFYDKKHEILHKYTLAFIVVWFWLLYYLDLILWVGLVPLFTLHFCNGLHRVFSHKDTTVKNRWYLEYIVPMGGEWIHDDHHIDSKCPKFSKKWYELDTGYIFVRLIKNG